MKPTALILILFLAASVLPAQVPAELEKMLTKQDDLDAQYNDLALKILYPAGVGREFDSFRLKNPRYLVSSYSRSKTAEYIRKLLAGNKGLLEVFEECGLSQGGEYYCRNPRCRIHGERIRKSESINRLSVMEFKDGVKTLSSAVIGIIVFVMTAGIGRGIVARIEKNIARKEKEKTS